MDQISSEHIHVSDCGNGVGCFLYTHGAMLYACALGLKMFVGLVMDTRHFSNFVSGSRTDTIHNRQIYTHNGTRQVQKSTYGQN